MSVRMYISVENSIVFLQLAITKQNVLFCSLLHSVTGTEPTLRVARPWALGMHGAFLGP